jgi:hypothetical protein
MMRKPRSRTGMKESPAPIASPPPGEPGTPKFSPGDLVMLRTPKSPVMVASEFVAMDLMGPCAAWVVHWTIQGALRRAVLPECALMLVPPEG